MEEGWLKSIHESSILMVMLQLFNFRTFKNADLKMSASICRNMWNSIFIADTVAPVGEYSGGTVYLDI